MRLPAGLLILATLPMAAVQPAAAAILDVGPGAPYPTIAGAVAAARAGDVVRVRAGTYLNDFPVVNKPLTLVGIGGLARIASNAWIPNEKGMIIAQADLTIDRFEFAGATVSDQNGAGIRYEGGNLLVRRSYFHDNQNGILAASNPTGAIRIENAEFARNGVGDGRTHAVYVNDIAFLRVSNSYFHDTVVGHHIKSRARKTMIQGNRLVDGNQQYPTSLSIDVPNGGDTVIENNQIEQAANAQNAMFISYSAESLPYSNSILRVRNNLFQNARPEFALGVLNNSPLTVRVFENSLYSSTIPVELVRGRAIQGGTTLLTRPVAISSVSPWR